MPKYKAILFDIDDTIMANRVDGYPTDPVTKALIAAQQHVHVGLASARTLAYAVHLFDHLQLSGPSILLGGCQIVDAASRSVLFEQEIELTAVEQILEVVRKMNLDCFIDEPTTKVAHTSAYKPATVLNIYIPKLQEAQANLLKQAFAHIQNITVHKATDFGVNLFALNISHGEVSKRHAIQKLADLLHITTDEIIGVGDGYNDLPLLEACGLKIAMGNAVDELKANADYVAPTVAEDASSTSLTVLFFPRPSSLCTPLTKNGRELFLP